MLWGNATFDDFQNPLDFLRKRIAFLNSKVTETSIDLNYSNILKGNLKLNISKDLLETPYKLVIDWENEKEEKYEFPQVKFGIQDDTVHIYAIQNHSKLMHPGIKRTLYKIGQGFDSKEDNYEIYGPGNLNDVTPSFLVALNMAVSYFNSLGYKNIVVPSMLIARWNAKQIMFNMMKYVVGDEVFNENVEEYNNTQHNLTEKLLRTFLRLAHHYESINVSSYPFEVDTSLHLSIDGELISNNDLLQETADLVINATKNKNL